MRRRLLLCVTAVLLVGCSDGVDDRRTTSAGPSGTAASVATSSPSPSATSSVPLETDSLTVPAPSAGSLDRDDVPAADDLGEGWETFVDPGGPEAGFQGNGDFVRERDPDEVVLSVVPLGCPGIDEVRRLPRPEQALEATYRDDRGRPAVALVLGYARESTAAAAVRAVGEMLATCTPPAEGERVETMRTVVDLRRADDQAVWDVRRFVGPGAPSDLWDEVVVRSGDRVALLAVARPPGTRPADLGRLAAVLRSQMGEGGR